MFWKDACYDNIKSHENQGFTLSLGDTFFETNPPPSPLNRVRFNMCYVILIKWTCYYFAMYKCLSTIVRVNGTV